MSTLVAYYSRGGQNYGHGGIVNLSKGNTEVLADRYGVSTSVIAQTWNLSKPVVTSPLIGASKTRYIDDAIAALDLTLTAEEMAYLEEPYVPHNQYDFR